MSQAAAQQPSRKKTVISLLVLLALTCIIVFTFKDHWAEITTALAQLSVWQVLAVLAVGVSYPLLEGCVAWVIVRSRLPQFTLRQGLDVGWCGTFGNVVTLGAGAVPVQLYYLHRAGLPLGPGAGLMTLEYVFHKSTVLLYATVMLLLQRRWLAANTTGVMRYLPMAYAVVAVIIVALVLLCVLFSAMAGHPYPLLLCILFLAVYMLVVRINTRRAFLANRVMRDQNMSFSFYADRFEVEYSGGHAVIPFDQLFALWETDTNFYLMLSPNQGYALSREGCNEDLAAFLRTKNAKKI